VSPDMDSRILIHLCMSVLSVCCCCRSFWSFQFYIWHISSISVYSCSDAR